MAADIGLAGTTLYITGTDSPDDCRVEQIPGSGALGGSVRVTFTSGSSTQQFSAPSLFVKKIVFEGKAGNDRFENNTSVSSEARGGIGNDTLLGGSARDLLFGEFGNDTLAGRQGKDEIYGGIGNDSLDGGDQGDDLYGGQGNDDMRGGLGDDELYGDAGNDVMHGDDGNDTLVGDAGADQMFGEGGDDGLSGGDGEDILIGGTGADRMSGNAGNDYLDSYDSDTDVVDGGAGVDTLVFEKILGKYVFDQINHDPNDLEIGLKS